MGEEFWMGIEYGDWDPFPQFSIGEKEDNRRTQHDMRPSYVTHEGSIRRCRGLNRVAILLFGTNDDL